MVAMGFLFLNRSTNISILEVWRRVGRIGDGWIDEQFLLS